MRHPPLRRCNSRNTHLCLGEGKRHDFRLFHTMEQMCLIAFQQREQLTDENMGGIVLVDTLRLFCCQLIENLLEALRNFVTPIFRKAAVLAGHQRYNTLGAAQMYRSFQPRFRKDGCL